MNNSFFMEFEFSDRVSGLSGEFHGFNLYDLNSTESIERLVNDALRILKEKRNGMVTFQLFTGFQSIDILRLFRSDGFSNAEMTEIFWIRNQFGDVLESYNTKNIAINKRNGRSSIYKATARFFEQETA